MTTPDGVLAAMASLFVLVAFGSVIPVVPTGAAVSATAAVVAHWNPATVVAAVIVGAAAAYAGDVVTYAVCRIGGEPVSQRLALSRRPIRIPDSVRRRLRERPVSALVVGRLLPAGRIPVLLAAAVVGVGWRRFAAGSVAACLVWSAVYAGVGLLGGAVFPEPWQAVLAAVALVLVASVVIGRLRRRPSSSSQTSS